MNNLSETASCSSAGARPLKCEACGKEFNCGASLSGCWCAEVQLSEAARADMQKRFSDCLCRECLEKSLAAVISNQ